MASITDETFNDVKLQEVQLVFQEVQTLSGSTISWKEPHILAAIIAGMRLGSAVGEPLTYKYANVIGVAVGQKNKLKTGRKGL